MRAAASSLVPDASRIAYRKDGACVEVSAYPSCHFVYYAPRPGVTLKERMRVAERHVSGDGWHLESQVARPGGAVLQYSRGDLRAAIALQPRPHRTCRHRARRCVESLDWVQVTRGV